ncbi:MAG: hypothetical protein RIQ79_1529 [Verrucomicrobiota bacterium]
MQTTTAPSATPRTSLLTRLLIALRNFALLLVLLVVVAFAATHLFAPNPGASAWPIRLLLGVALVIGPGLAFGGVFGKRPQIWPPYAALAASLALLVIWLKHDDPVLRHPPGTAALRSDFPDAAASHTLTLRYSSNVPGSLHDTLKYPANLFLRSSPSFEKIEQDAEWIAFITENRAKIEARWLELAPVRAWIDDMAAAPELADHFQKFSDPIVAFKPLREVSNYANALAVLYALDGHPDEAVATILPVFTAAQKLEVHGRTLVRRMISVVLQKNALTTLRIVLDHSEVSPAARARIAAALAPAYPAEENARLLFLCEYETSTVVFGNLYDSTLLAAFKGNELSLLHYFPLYNHTATMNLAGDLATDLASLGVRRDQAGIVKRQADFAASIPRSFWPRKNLVGFVLLNMSTPSFQRVTERYWEVQDYRAALLKRL